jgi:short-subunit dehydrogenase
MKILIIGANGAIGKKLTATFQQRGHDVLTAGRNSGAIKVDITDPASIENMYRQTGNIDACICTAGTGYYGPFDQMTTEMMMPGTAPAYRSSTALSTASSSAPHRNSPTNNASTP